MLDTVTVEDKLHQARTRLYEYFPDFGALSLRFRVVESVKGETQTLATDGTTFYWNAAAVAERALEEVMFGWAHEVVHCMLGHIWRFAGDEYDHKLANIACDYVANYILVKAGMTMWPGALLDEQYYGWSAEQIYWDLKHKQDVGEQVKGTEPGYPKQPDFLPPAGPPDDVSSQPQQNQGDNPIQNQQPGTQDGVGIPRPGNQGQAPRPQQQEGKPDTKEQHDAYSEMDWAIAAEEERIEATKYGRTSGDADRAFEREHEELSDSFEVLRKFIASTLPTDYTWTRPHNRYIGFDVYLPSILNEGTPRLGIAIDTSSSVNQTLLAKFAGQVDAIMQEFNPEELEVVYCNTAIRNVQVFHPGEEVKLSARGGGGTAFQPALDHFADNPPAAVVYFTDLRGPTPDPPPFPVLWAVPPNCRETEPFGEKVVIR